MAEDDFDLEYEAALLRETYERGDKSALVKTILAAFVLREAVPDWAVEAFVDACDSVMTGHARSWDDVFGSPHPQGAHLYTIQKERRRFEVYRLVREIHEKEGVPIDDGLFERVGRETGLGGKTAIADLYGKVGRMMRRLDPKKG
jgi:hypothetical protein